LQDFIGFLHITLAKSDIQMTDVSIEQSSLLLDGMIFSGLFHHQISPTATGIRGTNDMY
jgi:hypothetical protein